jgi:hypothetical protein
VHFVTALNGGVLLLQQRNLFPQARVDIHLAVQLAT